MELRPYQKQSHDNIIMEWEKGVSKTLLVLPTGCGKTIVFSKVIETMVGLGNKVLVMAHRGELLDQAADKLEKSTGLRCSKEKAEETSEGSWCRVTVGSVQSMASSKRLGRFTPNDFDVIIVDEAHHCLSPTYQKVLEHFNKAKVLGVTATPDRGDKKNLGQYFESLAYEYTLPKAIKEGYLSPIKAMTIPINLDLTQVATQSGDYKLSDIGNVLDPYLEKIAEEMLNYCKDRKTVIFLPLISTSQKFQSILNEKGFRAAEVNGNSTDRDEVLKDFDEGKYNVLCNSMLLTEGWDCPTVDCVIVLRPTKVRSLYSQMVGRGTRLSPGKEDLLLLDFLWHSKKHELSRPAHLICETEEVAQKMVEKLEENVGGVPLDLEELEIEAESDVANEREEALAKALSEMKKRRRALVDPLQFEMSIDAEDLKDYVPEFGYKMGPPTEKQKKALEKAGIFPDEIDNQGKAELLLDRLAKRRIEGYATPKQIRRLESYGFNNVGQWQFEQASNMISRIAANNWRLPKNINPINYHIKKLNN